MGDFLDFNFDNALQFDFQMPSVASFQYPSEPAPIYDFGYSEPLSFDFQPSAFELQGPVWDANSWIRETAQQEPTFNLGGGFERGGQISHYDPAPAVLQQKLAAAHRPAAHADD